MNRMISALQELSQVKRSVDPRRNEIKCVEEQAVWEHLEETAVVPELGATRSTSEGAVFEPGSEG